LIFLLVSTGILCIRHTIPLKTIAVNSVLLFLTCIKQWQSEKAKMLSSLNNNTKRLIGTSIRKPLLGAWICP